MSVGTLKALRFIVPGVLITVMLDPLLSTPEWLSELELLPDTQFVTEVVGYPVNVLVGSTVYHVLDLRGIAFRKPIQVVQNNIKNSLLSCCEGHGDLLAHEDYLRQGRRLMHVFYKIVDGDPTLQEKANRVRFNGAFLSLWADLQVVPVLGAVIYLITAAISRSLALLTFSATLLGVGILFGLTMGRVTRKHLDLSNEQLEIIAQYHCSDVRSYLSQLVIHDDK